MLTETEKKLLAMLLEAFEKEARATQHFTQATNARQICQHIGHPIS